MTTPAWTRPQWKPRLLRIVPVAAVASCGVAFVAGLVAGGGGSSTMTVPVVTAVHLTLPAPPPAPPPTVVVQPAPAPEPPPPPAPPPRATSPHLMTMCLFAPKDPETSAPRDASCTWDDGFPAISADGRLIATRSGPDYTPGPEPEGPSDGFQLIDARTGRTVRWVSLLSPEEHTTEPEPLARLQATVRKRVAATQRMLDERGFRTLRPLGTGRAGGEPRGDVDETKARSEIYAEFADEQLRLIDPVTATELGRHSFAVPPPRVMHEDDFCGSWNFNSVSAWWDPVTRIVLGRSVYRTGGCMCSHDAIFQTYRLPAPR